VAGINYCFAKLLLERNCNVVIGDLGLRPEAQKLVDEYSGKGSEKPRATFVKTDVAQWPDLDTLFAAADKEFGGADIVGVRPVRRVLL
jgi:NAD(P)-dependent dehydrogenase (short-subunit alcohol dehydrogenase family)